MVVAAGGGTWVTGPWITPAVLLWVPAGIAAALAPYAVLVTGPRLTADTERTVVPSRPFGPLAAVRRILGWAAPPAPAAPPRIGLHPLRWKESRFPSNPWVRWALRAGLLGYFLLLAWLWFHPKVTPAVADYHGRTAFFDVVVSLPLWLYLLAVIPACGTFLAEERERNSLDLLRVAPIPAGEFALARLLGTARRLAPLAAVTAPFALVGLFTGQVHLPGVLAWILGVGLVAPFLALLSFRAGMGAATVRSASRRVGTVVGLFLLVWPFLVGFLGELFRLRARTMATLFAMDPLVAPAAPYTLFYTTAVDRDQDGQRFGFAGTLVVLLCAGAAAVLWTYLPRHLDRALHAAEDA